MKSLIKVGLVISVLMSDFLGSNLNGQSITPVEGVIMLNDAPRACIVVNIEPQPRELKQAWADYLKEQFNLKLMGSGLFNSKHLLYAEEVSIPQISPKTLNLYTNVVRHQNGSEMKVFASFGYDIYLDPESSPDEYYKLFGIVENFLKQYLPAYHQEEVDALENQITNLLKEQDKLQNHISRNSNKIDRLNSEIDRMHKKLKDNHTAHKLLEIKLKKSRAKLAQIKNQLVQM